MNFIKRFFCIDQINKRADYSFYQLGKIIWIPAIIFGLLFTYWLFPSFVKNSYPCAFEAATGYPCPGCGGTRAVVALFEGKILGSFFYNPAVLTAVVSYIQFMIMFFLRKNVFKNIEERKIKVEVYAYVFIFVIILQWVIKCIIIYRLNNP